MASKYQSGDEPIGGYRLIEFLGRGGFGEVWKAYAPGRTLVALKLIRLDQRHVLRELDALRLVKLIRHPNLVSILAFWLKDAAGGLLVDADEESALKAIHQATTPTSGKKRTSAGSATPAVQRPHELILAMGLGDRNLSDRLQECHARGLAGIPPAELFGYLEDAARAIDFLNQPTHDLGAGPIAIQHCDIKPQNILIVSGAAQVCDFGLAQALGQATGEAAAGSPAYAAPETLLKQQPSPFTDQYSLAISYAELRTGKLPLPHRSFQEVYDAHTQGNLDFTNLSQAEQAVLKRATARNPEERFPTVRQMVQELRQAYGALSSTLPTVVPGSGPGLALAVGRELVPGYRLVRDLVKSPMDEVWEATAPGGKKVALLIRDLSLAPESLDLRALALVQRLEDGDRNHLTELHAYWLLDAQGRVVPDELRGQPDLPPPSRLVIAGKLARKTLLRRWEECQEANVPGIPLVELMDYMRQLAIALDYLNAPQHQIGDDRFAIQHRHVQPGSIMLYDAQVRLGNFSFAQCLRRDAISTSPDVKGLAHPWVAPEILKGQLTRWSDQYSLARTYLQLRTGELPPSGQLPKKGLLDAERTVLARATALQPDERFPSCTEFVVMLETACALEGQLKPTGKPLSLPPANHVLDQAKRTPANEWWCKSTMSLERDATSEPKSLWETQIATPTADNPEAEAPAADPAVSSAASSARANLATPAAVAVPALNGPFSSIRRGMVLALAILALLAGALWMLFR